MCKAFLVLGAVLLASFGIASAKPSTTQTQEKPKDSQDAADDYKPSRADLDKKNPVKPSAESLAAARKIYGYDCAMCHGDKGNGNVVESMKLTMHDWREPATLEGKTDGEIFYIITKGKGKMMGEGERVSETVRWNLVNLVRSYSKKDAGN